MVWSSRRSPCLVLRGVESEGGCPGGFRWRTQRFLTSRFLVLGERDGLSLLGFAFEMASAAKLNLGLFRDGDFPFS